MKAVAGVVRDGKIRLSYICRSCGEVIKEEWREFGPEYVFGDMCLECKEAEAKYGKSDN